MDTCCTQVKKKIKSGSDTPRPVEVNHPRKLMTELLAECKKKYEVAAKEYLLVLNLMTAQLFEEASTQCDTLIKDHLERSLKRLRQEEDGEGEDSE
jgi:hypothetical protein